MMQPNLVIIILCGPRVLISFYVINFIPLLPNIVLLTVLSFCQKFHGGNQPLTNYLFSTITEKFPWLPLDQIFDTLLEMRTESINHLN